MAGLLEMILKSQNGAGVEQLAKNFGISGNDAGIPRKMLPIVASMLMAGLSKQGNSVGAMNQLGSGATSQTSGPGDMLGSFLDANKDGSVVDDIFGHGAKIPVNA